MMGFPTALSGTKMMMQEELCGPRGLGSLVLGLNYSENPFLRQMQQPSLRRGGASASRKVEVVMQQGVE